MTRSRATNRTVLSLLAGSLLLVGLWAYRRSPTPEAATAPSVASFAGSAPGASSAPFAGTKQPYTPQPSATPPWAATKENSPTYLPEGYVPAWQVKPEPPAPVAAPPAPTPPPDPLTTTPSPFNPGGINGSRPPRSD